MDVRRVVAGLSPDGISLFDDVGGVEAIETLLYPGASYWQVWGTRTFTGALVPGANAEVAPFFPAAGESRFMIVRFAPATTAGAAASTASPAEAAKMRADAHLKLPGIVDVHDDDGEGGAHATATLDYVIVLEGELELELDHGETEILRPGTCVVQRGARHTWHNRTSETAVAAFVMLGIDC